MRDSDITPTDAQAEALRSVLPALQYDPEPCGRAVVERMVGKASYAYPSAKLTEAEAKIRLDVYADALQDLPADILGMAFVEAIKTVKFFPAVAELRAIADKELNRRRFMRWKVEHLLSKHERDAQPQISAEEREEVRKLMADLSRKLAA